MRVAPVPERYVFRKSLYRKWAVGVTWIMVWLVLGQLASVAQMPQLKRPEEAPVEKPPEPAKKKNVKGPRAVGLLQLNSSGKGTLIPVAILVEGKFYDASVYKADPVPMALEGGTVYEVEKSGESQGLFTVTGALHSKNPTSPTPWMGAGSYLLNGSEVAKKAHRAEDKPIGLDNDNDAPPKLTRGKETSGADQSSGTSSTTNAGGSDASAKGSSGQASKPAASEPEKSADKNAKSQGTPSAAGQAPSAPPNQGSTGADASSQGAPNQSSPSGGSAADSSAGTKGDEGQGSQSEYRPTLRRGKPTQTVPEEVDDAVKPDTKDSTAKAAGGVAVTAGTKPVRLTFLPAISDEGGPPPQSYQFFWKEGEEDDRRKQMLAVAANEVRLYVSAREKGTIPAKAAVAKGGAMKDSVRKAAAKVEPVFENIQFRAFDVWKNNQPVMVLTAEAHLPMAAGASTTPLVYDVAIAARTDIYGDLRKLYAGVTDKFHLDVTPRLELIDVVDADGDGRGELLFRETADAGNGYVIYRATGDTLWKMFDSLGGE